MRPVAGTWLRQSGGQFLLRCSKFLLRAALGGGAHFVREARSVFRAQPLRGVPEEFADGEEQHDEQSPCGCWR